MFHFMSVHNPRFEKIYIEISNECNLACTFCPIGQNDSPKASTSSKTNHLSIQQFDWILNETKGMTKEYVLHVLGEPTTHPQLLECLDLAQKRAAAIQITTNGILIHRPEVEKSLLHASVRQVNFSLQSWVDNFKIENISTYLSRIFHFIEKALVQRPDLYINLRIWNESTNEERILKNWHYLKPIGDFFQTDLTQIQTQVSFKKSRRLKNRVYLNFDSRFEWPKLDSAFQSKSGFCYGLKSHLAVLNDGRVVPCCLDSEGVIELGNLFESPLTTILSSDRARELRLGFDQHLRKEELCQKCSYINRFNRKSKGQTALSPITSVANQTS